MATLNDENRKGRKATILSSIFTRLICSWGLGRAALWKEHRPGVWNMALVLPVGPWEKLFYINFGLFILRLGHLSLKRSMIYNGTLVGEVCNG